MHLVDASWVEEKQWGMERQATAIGQLQAMRIGFHGDTGEALLRRALAPA